MPRTEKHESHTAHNGDSSFVSLLSGWMQQGVENLFATQRILVDLAMGQNANVLHMVRSRFGDPDFCPVGVVSEFAGEAMENFIEGQKLLLGLLKREQQIVTDGVKERVSGNTVAVAATEATQRGLNTFIDMHQEFLRMASKQTHAWLTAIKAGRPFDPENLIEMAREGMDTFVESQKKFLDMLAEETTKATSTKTPAKMKKTEIAEMAKEATEAFIEAQKRLMDVVGEQVNVGMKAAGRAVNMIGPLPFLRIPDFTREGVKNFVTAEKALIDTVMQRNEPRHTTKTPSHRARRRGRTIKMEAGHATA